MLQTFSCNEMLRDKSCSWDAVLREVWEGKWAIESEYDCGSSIEEYTKRRVCRCVNCYDLPWKSLFPGHKTYFIPATLKKRHSFGVWKRWVCLLGLQLGKGEWSDNGRTITCLPPSPSHAWHYLTLQWVWREHTFLIQMWHDIDYIFVRKCF